MDTRGSEDDSPLGSPPANAERDGAGDSGSVAVDSGAVHAKAAAGCGGADAAKGSEELGAPGERSPMPQKPETCDDPSNDASRCASSAAVGR